jgi:hypothetical protein
MTAVKMGGLREYRCHIGHRIGLQTMIARKRAIIEHALGIALAQSEELTDLLEESREELPSEEQYALKQEIVERREEEDVFRTLMAI